MVSHADAAKKSFLHRIVTGDEKWIKYDNPKCLKSYMKPGQLVKSNINDAPALYSVVSKRLAVL